MASLILVLYIVSVIGFDASAIYYDAFLTDVTTEDRMDKVSTMGYGLGYIGGSTIPLLIFLIMNLVGVPMLTCLAFVFGPDRCVVAGVQLAAAEKTASRPLASRMKRAMLPAALRALVPPSRRSLPTSRC